MGTFRIKFGNFFHQHSQPLHNVLQEVIENHEFSQDVKFKFIDSLKNNRTEYFLIFDVSCEENCNSKAIVDFATGRRYRGVIIFHIKHNLFHQGSLSQDVELQNTHAVLFKSPCDVMQVTTITSQLGLW